MARSLPAAGRPSWRRPVVLLLLAAAGIGALAYFFLADAEVLEKGRLLSYTEGKIYKVRFGGGLVLYIEPDLKPSLDLLNAYLLTGIAFIALSFAALLAGVAGDTSSSAFRFFALVFLGASYLVADEILGIHETVGHNLQFLRRLPLIERPDDAVILLMAIPAAAVLFFFRGVLLSSKAATALCGASLALFVLSAVADLLTLPGEEIVEVLAALCLVAAMVLLGLHHARAALGGDQGSPPGGTT